MTRSRRLAFCFISLMSGAAVLAQVSKPDNGKAANPAPAKKADAKPKVEENKPDEWLAPMDYGPFLMTSVARGGKPYKNEPFEAENVPKFSIDTIPDMVAVKGIVIPLGPKDANGKPAATVVFDTEKLSMAAGWTGGWLDLTGSMLTNHKGTSLITTEGTEVFRNGLLGWAAGRDIAAIKANETTGTVKTRYVGHSVVGRAVIFRYQVDGVDIQEGVELHQSNTVGPVIIRTFNVGPRNVTLQMSAMSAGKEANFDVSVDSDNVVQVKNGTSHTSIGMRLHPDSPLKDGLGTMLDANTGSVRYRVPPSAQNTVFQVLIAAAPLAQFQEEIRRLPATAKLPAITTPASVRWQPITTTGKLGDAPGTVPSKAADPAFVADELTLPFKNDYNSWFRLGGLDFFSDGRIAVCTINGDVWVVSGVDAKLEKLTWTRFATGLYQPLGLRIVNEKIYVRGRDQITRLHDLNADGEADFYENFSHEGETHPSYHGLVFDLQTDAAGNFYYARGGIGMRPDLEGHGQMIQLSPDGQQAKAIASGLRAPNGLGVLRGKWLSVGDNQGNWIPTSRISLVDPAGPNPFLGFLPHHHQKALPAEPAPPLVWIPHAMDNSSGGQCEIPASTWGDFSGQWIHSSFGAASVMLLLPDAATPTDQMPKQAAIARIPLEFATGVMRPRFNPRDGQLYVAGVGGGWQTKGTADGGLYRIRHNGKASHLPTKFAVVPGGVQLSFAVALDKEDAADPDNYAVEQWNYKWSEKYGSPDFSAVNPDKAGHDEVKVKAVTVSDDGKTVTLKLDDFRPVNQMLIECRLITAEDKDLNVKVYATINAVP